MKPAPEVQKEKIIPNINVLRVMILSGTRPESFFRICIATKIPIEMPNTRKSTMTRAFFQAYSLPPHCKANKRHIIDAKNITNEGRSSISILFLKVVFFGGFIWSMKTTIAKVGAERIGFIQKILSRVMLGLTNNTREAYHRQVVPEMIAPPTIGPAR